MSFVTAWRRDTTRERWAASWPARPTCRPVERRFCRWGSWGPSSRATRSWAEALRDDDLAVRSMAEDALWADLVSRRYAPSTTRSSSRCGTSISREQLEQAETLGRPG